MGAQLAPGPGRIHVLLAAGFRQGVSVAYSLELYAKRAAQQMRYALTSFHRRNRPECFGGWKNKPDTHLPPLDAAN